MDPAVERQYRAGHGTAFHGSCRAHLNISISNILGHKWGNVTFIKSRPDPRSGWSSLHGSQIYSCQYALGLSVRRSRSLVWQIYIQLVA